MRRVRLKPPRVPAGSTATYAWWRVGVTSARDRWCFSCEKTIPTGKHHARDDNGRRLCQVCVEASEVNGEQSAREVNRRQRHGRIERAEAEAIRFLLDGLDVRSIGDLKRLVDAARAADRLREMVRQDAEWARDVLHAGTYKAGGSHPGDRALAYLERIIERTGDPDGT